MRKQGEQSRVFEKYQHNQELVKFINLYKSKEQDENDVLSSDWEEHHDSKKRVFYVNHKGK